jgi:arylsulfatase A-like enzyme
LVVPPGRLTGRGDDKAVEIRSVADEVIELRDVMTTLLDAAGLPIPDTIDGGSLLPLLHGPAESWRAYIHGEYCTCYSTE